MNKIKTIDTKVFYPHTVSENWPKRPIHLFKREKQPAQIEILALVPVYNKAEHIKKTLDSLLGFADAAIILDDGSTDNTNDIVKQHPLTIEILTKPAKTLNEWNDSLNRYELYISASKYNPNWIFCIDADESIDLRFEVFKDDLTNIKQDVMAFAFYVIDVDRGKCIRQRYGHRMYRYKENYRFDRRRLHCRLLPLEITPSETLLSNLVIYHDSKEETRTNRYNKYKQADPKLEYQSSYEHLKSPIVSKEIPFRLSNHILTKVVEDGLQRKFYKNYTRQLLELKNKSKDVECFILSNIELLKENWIRFNSLNLDAYHIVKNQSRYECVYAFDSSICKHISVLELFVIEEIQRENNFPNLLSNLLTYANWPDIRCLSEKLNQVLNSLTEKKILIDKNT